MKSFLTSLGVAAITGLTYVAYQHPPGYGVLATGLLPFIGLSLLSFIAWRCGNIWGLVHTLSSRIKSGSDEDIRFMKSEIVELRKHLSELALVVGIGAAIAGYLAFLWYLPRILGTP